MTDALDPQEALIQFVQLERRIGAVETKLRGLDGMTLAEIEAMAARLGAAAKTIRDAQALLGGGTGSSKRGSSAGPETPRTTDFEESAPPPIDPAAAHRLRQMQPVEGRRPRMVLTEADLAAMTPAERQRHERGGNELGAADLAERQRRLAQFQPLDDPNLPDEIRAMERGE